MKNSTLYSLLLLILTSCTTMKAIDDGRQVDKGREPGEQFFIIKENGEKIISAKITRPAVGNHIESRITVDGKKMDGPKLFAFQDTEGYYAWLKETSPTKYWKGRFIKRVRRGKINLYYYGSRGTYDNSDYYYFEKEKGKFEPLTFESFSTALSDNQPALQELRRRYPKGKILDKDTQRNSQDLPAIVELYNQ